MLLACAISIATGLAVAAFHFLKPVDDSPEARFWMRNWIIRGLGIPTFAWMLFNSGLLPGLPSFGGELDRATGFNWLHLYSIVAGFGITLICTYWAAFTLLCLLMMIWSQTEDRKSFLSTAGVWTVLLSPVILGLGFWGRWYGAGLLGVLWFFPIYYSTCEMAQVVKKKPVYSRAVAHMHRGKYEAAEAAVIEELENDESDFDGWIMLAELYAVHFNDLAAADRTIHELCRDPAMSVSQISVALHKLADWYLKLSQDPTTARRVLEEICQRMPGTHLDRMARLRINHLPASRKEYIQAQETKPIALPHLDDQIDDAPGAGAIPVSLDAAKAQADQLIEELRVNPNDLATRVSLARILAEQLGNVALGIEQLELLLALPGIDPRQAAEWLNLMAGWHIRINRDENAAELLLERITRLNPQSVEAFTAQRRLNLMRRESKVRAKL